jgi:hypothetical protein
MRTHLILMSLATASIAHAAVPAVVHGPDLEEVARTTGNEGPDMNAYLGHSFDDIGEYRTLRDQAGRHLIVVVGYDRNKHPTDTDNIELACPAGAQDAYLATARAGKTPSGDRVRIAGRIDTVETRMADDTAVATILLKPGCRITPFAPGRTTP